MNGVLTYLFTKIIREYPEITYGRLLQNMHDEIKKINRSRCNNRILQHIFNRKIAQVGFHITTYCHEFLLVYTPFSFVGTYPISNWPCLGEIGHNIILRIINAILSFPSNNLL